MHLFDVLRDASCGGRVQYAAPALGILAICNVVDHVDDAFNEPDAVESHAAPLEHGHDVVDDLADVMPARVDEIHAGPLGAQPRP